ncbi:hypothetical protein SprV_0902652100 [Sparganum proliferum]
MVEMSLCVCLRDEDANSPTASQETTSNELPQRLDNVPVTAAAAAAAADVNVFSTALAVLGRARQQHQDWFGDNDVVTSNLLAEKNRLHKAYVDHPTDDNRAAFYRSRRHPRQQLHEMQDAWTARKAEEIQEYADRNEWKNFFSAIKVVYGSPTESSAPLLSADGSTLLTEKTQILQRWAEHFRDVLNRPSTISTAPSTVCRKRRPTWTSTFRHLSRKPSGPCGSSPAGKRPDRMRSLRRSTSTVVPNEWIT